MLLLLLPPLAPLLVPGVSSRQPKVVDHLNCCPSVISLSPSYESRDREISDRQKIRADPYPKSSSVIAALPRRDHTQCRQLRPLQNRRWKSTLEVSRAHRSSYVGPFLKTHSIVCGLQTRLDADGLAQDNVEAYVGGAKGEVESTMKKFQETSA